MKTTQKHFELFKSECRKWIDLLELNNFETCFSHRKIDSECYAECHSNASDYVATITLNTFWDGEIRKLNDEEIRITARHEAIHLLLSRLSGCGHDRDSSHNDIREAEEETVRKLLHFIKKVYKEPCLK